MRRLARRCACLVVALAFAGACTADGDANLPPLPDPPPLGAGFVDVTPVDAQLPFVVPEIGPREPDLPTGGMFADFDREGHAELVLTANGGTGVYGYVAREGRFSRITLPSPLVPRVVHAMTDLDADGSFDAVTGQGGVQWGAPRLRFGLESTLWPASGWQATNSAMPADLDADGWLDVLVGPIFVSPPRADSYALYRTGIRAFTPRPLHPGYTPPSATKSYVFAPVELVPGERVVMNLGESRDPFASPPAAYRVARDDAEGYPVFEPFDPTPRDATYKEGDARRSLVFMAPMGAATGDLDGDGLNDLFVAVNPWHTIFQGTGTLALRDRTARSGFARIPGRKNFQLPWGSAIVDVDQDGRPDVLATHGDDGNSRGWEQWWIGPQRVTLQWNAGEFRFVDVTDAARLGLEGQWRALSLADFDCDGDADLVVGGINRWPRVYRNDVAAGNRGFSLSLRGTSSNSLGLGARIEVRPEGSDAVLHFAHAPIASPVVSADPVTFAGLGKAGAARVTVRWPSGLVHEAGTLEAGRCHVVEEPPTFSIEPASRHLPADGSSVARLVIMPRNPDGTLRTGAGVHVVRPHGTGDVGWPVLRDDGAWEVEVRAPREPGSGVFEIRIDGVSLGVRPRIWWDPA